MYHYFCFGVCSVAFGVLIDVCLCVCVLFAEQAAEHLKMKQERVLKQRIESVTAENRRLQRRHLSTRAAGERGALSKAQLAQAHTASKSKQWLDQEMEKLVKRYCPRHASCPRPTPHSRSFVAGRRQRRTLRRNSRSERRL
jgi:hypothetical protein